MPLPPPPTQDSQGSYAWLEWFRQLRNYITQVGSVPWSIIDFTGSTLSSIASRSHQVLQALQGGTTGEYYHLTSAQHGKVGLHNQSTDLQGGTTNEYYHLTSAEDSALASGITATITLAKITALGSNGSLTFTNGILTSKTDPT